MKDRIRKRVMGLRESRRVEDIRKRRETRKQELIRENILKKIFKNRIRISVKKSGFKKIFTV